VEILPYILVSAVIQSAEISECSGWLFGILFRDYSDQRNRSKDSFGRNHLSNSVSLISPVVSVNRPTIASSERDEAGKMTPENGIQAKLGGNNL
jgi:hypothetical protein